jgi:hypothetical protein
MLQSGRSLVRVPMRSLDFLSWHNPSSRIMALESTQPVTEISTRNFPGGKGRPARKADTLTAICGLSTKHGSLDVAKPYGPPRPVTRIALSFIISRYAPYMKKETFSIYSPYRPQICQGHCWAGRTNLFRPTSSMKHKTTMHLGIKTTKIEAK